MPSGAPQSDSPEPINSCPSPEAFLIPDFAPHEATILAWPYQEESWGERFLLISWCYAELVRIIAQHEKVILFCHDEEIRDAVAELLKVVNCELRNVSLEVAEYEHCWLRDFSPVPVRSPSGNRQWSQWGFNVWGKGERREVEENFGRLLAQKTNIEHVSAARSSSGERVVLEGGAFDTDGEGTLLVTESCLLYRADALANLLSKEFYEEILKKYFGVGKVIWLKSGLTGDSTGGHLDNVARFIAPGHVVLAWEENPSSPNYAISRDNLLRLQEESDAAGRALQVSLLPLPSPVLCLDEVLPASYTNFYCCNQAVLVPTFNDPLDRIILNQFAEFFPERTVYGVYVRDLLSGGGALHCITQFLPAA